MGKVIAITNQKGGVGKTTTAINLSAAVAAKGYAVMIIDIDPQGNTTSGLGIDKSLPPSIYDVMINGTPLESAIRETGFENLSIVSSQTQLAGAEIELVSLEGRETRLKSQLSLVRERYDYIFIDCPPSLSLLTINAMTASDRILVPIQCEYFALEGVGQLVNTISLIQKRLNPLLEIEGVVLTMLDGRTNLGIQVVAEVKKYFGGKVYKSIIPRNVRLSEAPSHGLPINIYDPRSTGAEAYRELADEFIEWNEQDY